MRRIAIMLAAFLLITTTACSQTGKNVASKAGSDSAKASSASDSKYTLEAKGKYTDGIKMPELKNKEITYMMNVDFANIEKQNKPDAPNTNYYAMLAWKETYGVDVKIETVQWDNYTSYLTTAIASGQSPDIIPGGPTWYPSWPANQIAKPLDEYIDIKDPIWNLNIMNQLKWDGKYYVTFTGEPLKNYIVYNKTKFVAAGEKTPLEYWKEGKWNWTQFVKTAKSMTNAKANDYGFTGWFLYPYFAPYSLTKTGSDGKIQLNMDDPKFVRWMTEVYNFYQVEKGARCDWDIANWRETIPQGKDAMCIMDTTDYLRTLQAAKEKNGDEFGIAPIPVFDPNGDTQSISNATIWGGSISAKAKNPEGAAAFLRMQAYISQNIKNEVGQYGLLTKYLTDDEKKMIDQTKNDPVIVQNITGIGKNQQIISDEIIFKMYVQPTKASVKSLLDAAKPLLEAEIDEFYKALKK